MQNLKLVASLIGLQIILAPSAGNAQATAFDACKALVTDDMQDVKVSTSSHAYLDVIYDKFCTSDHNFNSSSSSLGVSAVIYGIPVSLTGKSNNVSEMAQQFCRNYSSHTEEHDSNYEFQKTVVRSGFQAFNTCMSIASSGISLKHHILLNTHTVTFFLAPGFSRPVTIEGVVTSSNVQCKGQNPNSDDGAVINFDQAVHIKVAADKAANFTCKIGGKTSANGDVTYDNASVALQTDIVPDGNYDVEIPGDTIFGETSATAIGAQLASNKNEIETLKSNFNSYLSDNIRIQTGYAKEQNIDTHGTTIKFPTPFPPEFTVKDVIVYADGENTSTILKYHLDVGAFDNNKFSWDVADGMVNPDWKFLSFKYHAIAVRNKM